VAPVRPRSFPVRIAFCIVLAVVLAVGSGLIGVVLGIDSFLRGVVDFFVLGALMLPLWRWVELRSRVDR